MRSLCFLVCWAPKTGSCYGGVQDERVAEIQCSLWVALRRNWGTLLPPKVAHTDTTSKPPELLVVGPGSSPGQDTPKIIRINTRRLNRGVLESVSRWHEVSSRIESRYRIHSKCRSRSYSIEPSLSLSCVFLLILELHLKGAVVSWLPQLPPLLN